MDFLNVDSAVMDSYQPKPRKIYAQSDIIIRAGRPEDKELIWEMHQRLSDDSLYSRYHSPRIPTKKEIAKICELKPENGRLLVATIPSKRTQIVGMAYYVLSGETAEAALLVEDSFQGQGIGKQLLKTLARQALAQGIRFFDAYVLPSNRTMMYLLYQVGQLVYNKLDYGTREIRISLKA
jgi:GNAT superfamily N-acetyltransferase